MHSRLLKVLKQADVPTSSAKRKHGKGRSMHRKSNTLQSLLKPRVYKAFLTTKIKRGWAGLNNKDKRKPCLSFLLVICYTTLSAYAQTNTRSSIASVGQNSANQFDAVSIRPSKGETSWGIGLLSNGYRAFGLPLWMTILKAYYPSAVRDRVLLKNAPTWVWTEKYDISAKINPSDFLRWNDEWHGSPLQEGTLLESMLQTLLRERCELTAHRVPAEIGGYALVIRKRGINSNRVKLAPVTEVMPPEASAIPQGGGLSSSENGPLAFWQTSMDSLSAELTLLVMRPIENRTGLSGKYDFTLLRTDDAAVQPEGAGSGVTSKPSWDLGSLGLDLVPIRVQTYGLVIDKIKRPTEN